jgi:cobalamin biosynthesis Mg chelatase CobN
MDNQDQMDVVKQQNNNEPSEKKLTGFQLHPENINQSGRPRREKTFTDKIRETLKNEPEKIKAITDKLLEMAGKGDLQAIREVLDRIEGKPIQTTEMTGAEGEAILIQAVKELEQTNYDYVAGEVEKQVVAIEPPIQNQGQAGQSDNVSPQPDTTATPIGPAQPPVQSDTQIPAGGDNDPIRN